MIDWIGANLAVYGPWLVGGMAMMETALLIGLVLPAEPTIIVATAFALEGHFSFGSVVIAAVLGAGLGDSVGFLVGRLGWRPGPARQGGAWHELPAASRIAPPSSSTDIPFPR